MAISTIGVILFFFFGRVLSQYEAMYLNTNIPEMSYDKTREEILNNFFHNKPLLSYVPVYNTDYGQWNSENQTVREDLMNHSPTCEFSQSKSFPETALQKLGLDVTKLTADVEALSEKTKSAYENKLKELNEMKKLSDDLKAAMQTTEYLKNGLREQEKLLSKGLQNGIAVTNPSGFEQFLKTMEGLESTVRNVNCKFEGKTGK